MSHIHLCDHVDEIILVFAPHGVYSPNMGYIILRAKELGLDIGGGDFYGTLTVTLNRNC